MCQRRSLQRRWDVNLHRERDLLFCLGNLFERPLSWGHVDTTTAFPTRS